MPDGGVAMENICFASPLRVKNWVEEQHPEAPPLKVQENFLDMIFGVIAKTTDPVSGMVISVYKQNTSGPDWKAIVMHIWHREPEYEKVIRDFGILAITSSTWSDEAGREDYKKRNPEAVLFKEVELYVE